MFGSDKVLARRFRDPADGDGSKDGAGGGAGDEDAAKKAEAAKAAQAEADKKAADKKAADKDAADKAEADKKTTDREAELLKESMARKAALKDANERINEMQEQLKGWEGLDIDQVRDLIKAQKDEETRRLEAKGEFDTIKKQMVEAHEAEMKTLNDTIKDLQSQIGSRDGEIDKLSIGNTFGQSQFIADKLTLPPTKARALYGAHFERNDEGKVVGYDKPAGAPGRALLVDGSGDPLAFDLALNKIVDADPDKDSLYKSALKPGAGSKTDPKGKGADESKSVGEGRDRIAAGISSGLLKSAKELNL